MYLLGILIEIKLNSNNYLGLLNGNKLGVPFLTLMRLLVMPCPFPTIIHRFWRITFPSLLTGAMTQQRTRELEWIIKLILHIKWPRLWIMKDQEFIAISKYKIQIIVQEHSPKVYATERYEIWTSSIWTLVSSALVKKWRFIIFSIYQRLHADVCFIQYENEAILIRICRLGKSISCHQEPFLMLAQST